MRADFDQSQGNPLRGLENICEKRTELCSNHRKQALLPRDQAALTQFFHCFMGTRVTNFAEEEGLVIPQFEENSRKLRSLFDFSKRRSVIISHHTL